MKSKEMPQSEFLHNATDDHPISDMIAENGSPIEADGNMEEINNFAVDSNYAACDDFSEIQIRYQQLLQRLPRAVYTCDASGYILSYNQAAAEL